IVTPYALGLDGACLQHPTVCGRVAEVEAPQDRSRGPALSLTGVHVQRVCQSLAKGHYSRWVEVRIGDVYLGAMPEPWPKGTAFTPRVKRKRLLQEPPDPKPLTRLELRPHQQRRENRNERLTAHPGPLPGFPDELGVSPV